MVISAETRARIDTAIAKYPKKRGALLSALHLVQEQAGWITPEAARELATIFDLHPIQVMEVVSFYNMFYDRPQGRHHVHVCTNLSCSLRGSRELLRQLEQHLGIEAGETTKDGRVTLDREECLGACAWAPVLRVDETYHENLDIDAAKRLVDGLE